MEVFLSEEVEPVLAHAAQKSVQHAGSKTAVGCVQKRPEQGRQSYCAASCPSFGEGLAIPGKETYRAHRPEVQEGALHPPVRDRGSDEG